ncbi:DNA excision repair protein ERCC-2 [Nematocida homosporus]|uniref:DNA excision repair protein ERCC-2 n=1 Tax=Nematocida homosporus TaxID=1912981 RepID=UPI00221E37EE|nr:DNA excision repair protein ERCC-2 [Nematocida homosporus]KAI5185821.1 DNA excision repair protein ERCC-2 [Nematocida homosporus]
MIVQLGELEVFFPMERIYPEQLQYIKELFEVAQGKGHCLIEMPTGTGKTLAILSFLVSYQIHLSTHGVGSANLKDSTLKRPNGVFKIVYCTRTTAELEKVLHELKRLYNYIQQYIPKLEYTGLGLAARRTLCVNNEVREGHTPREINAGCHRIRSTCPYYTELAKDPTIPPGIHTLEDLVAMGTTQGKCPYYLARSVSPLADCLVYTYNYMIDPRISNLVSAGLGSNCIVVFDEAHNIDSACIEALSVGITRSTLDAAWKSICDMESLLQAADITRISGPGNIGSLSMASYQNTRLDKPAGIDSSFAEDSHACSRSKTSQIPGSLRTTRGFISAAKRVIEFFKTRLKTVHLTAETTESFIWSLESTVFVEYSALVHLSKQLRAVIAQVSELSALDRTKLKQDSTEQLNSSELAQLSVFGDFQELSQICDFCSLAAQFKRGFSVIFEPFNSFSAYEPILRLCCLDASIAIQRVFSTYKNVIITSGTLSPISIYPRLLNFAPVKSVEIDVTNRRGLGVLIVTKGSDQMTLAMTGSNEISSGFSLRSEPAVVRNYGNLLLEMAAVVPDGLACFFPSYKYMEEAVSAWTESGMIKKIIEKKLIFAESLDHEETERALAGYKTACEIGRGAIMLSVARGKVSEGVDFSGCYGRAVLVFGVPFQYTESPQLKKRLEFLAEEFGVRESEFLSFDAMRQAAQCIGRVLRSSRDYGLAVLADRRFNVSEKKQQLPRWVQRHLEDESTNLSIDMSISLARQFFRQVSTSKYYN